MKTALIIILLSAIVASAGTISGEIVYPPDGMGLYVVVAISPDDLSRLLEMYGTGDTSGIGEFLMSLPRDQLFSPGEFSIDGDFVDGVPYTIFGLKLSGMSVQSGDPMGLSNIDVITHDGNARGVMVELATESDIGGYINYFGEFPGCKINVYDAMQNPPALESTYTVSSVSYTITVPSGFKTMEFYIDDNGNNRWDQGDGESGTYYFNPVPRSWGPIVFSGGGNRFSHGVDVILLPSEITETKQNDAPQISYSPSGEIRFSNCDGDVSITDILGKIIFEKSLSGNEEIRLDRNLPSGTYFIIFNSMNQKSVRKINLIH